jgi:hypothetical protein
MDFYATSHGGYPPRYMPTGYHWLFPASSWYNTERGAFRKLRLPDHVTSFAIDCGGFVAARKWGGVYRYTSTEYINWIYQLSRYPQWAAIQDFCCEDEITAGRAGIVRERQQATTWKIEKYWRDYRHEKWCWIPTVQGWLVEDYINHALAIKPLVQQWQAFYAARGQADVFRVGIGTLCARSHVADIQAIVMAVADILPSVRFHLFGVKLQVLKSDKGLPRVLSTDSAAGNGNFGKDRHKNRAERIALGQTKNEHELQTMIPRYVAKVAVANGKPKQLTLWHERTAA